MVRNMFSHWVLTLNMVSLTYGSGETRQLQPKYFQFHPDKLQLLVMLASHSYTLKVTEWYSRILFWETTVYLEWMNKGMEHDTVP